MEFNSINDTEVNSKRPTFLLVLCILSYISIGFGLLGTLTSIFSGPLSMDEMDQLMKDSWKIVEAIQSNGNSDISGTLEMVLKTQEYINSNFYAHHLTTLLALVSGFIGVYLMFNKKSRGFHFYIIYNVISILIYYVSVPFSEVPSILVISNTIFSAIFILMYSRNLSWMKE